MKKRIKKPKWKLYLYYNNQLIKKIKVDENFLPLEETYILRVLFKKHLFGSNNVVLAFRFKALKLTNEEKRISHIELKVWEGVSK